tara:strand:- start:426 stop:962 length:537 start_codon:yes stop_codon:yes gene_type:complete
MTQYARPDNDTSNAGSWQANDDGGSPPSTLHECLSKTTASADQKYITVTDDEAEAKVCVIRLGDVTDPSSTSSHRFYWNAKDQGSELPLTVSLLVGSDVVASKTTTLTGSYADDYLELGGSETNFPSDQADYNNLQLKFSYIDDETFGDTCFVRQAWFQCPDAAAAATTSPAFLLFVD